MKKIALLCLLALIIGSCQTEPLIDDIQTNQNVDILDKKISQDFPETMSLEAYAELIQSFIERPTESNIIDVGPLNETECYVTNRNGIIQYYNYNEELQLFEAIDNFSGRTIDYTNESNKLPSYLICLKISGVGGCWTAVRFHPYNALFFPFTPWWTVSVMTTCNYYNEGETTTISYYPGGLTAALAICAITI
ncbi:hypothetical protein [uncultured Psychroserpens sp.]|uniref:hypothetical protein n=1 Tax=uncultured Psychroserpens sp. TaxID=255436 RepID=UPI002612578D|nr:hypothetical protein [uncultured Psychroserpens sp.]